MASQPSDESADSKYRSAWGEVGAAMEGGVSWSGHERNRAWVNTGDGRFIDASFVTGLDHIDDGRVALRVDWDLDGDEDLFLRFRSGPQLRYMERQGGRPWRIRMGPSDFVECPHGERPVAVRVEVAEWPQVDVDQESGRIQLPPIGKSIVRTFPLRPLSDGYLSSSDSQLNLNLSSPVTLKSVELELHDGRTVDCALSPDVPAGFDGLISPTRSPFIEFPAVIRFADGQWSLHPEHGDPSDAESPRDVDLAAGQLEAQPLPSRVVLRLPLPLPPERAKKLGVEHGATLLVIRSETCGICERVVPPIAGAASADPAAMPRLVVATAESPDPNLRHAEFMHAIATALLGPGTELGFPLMGLIDGEGRLQVLYMGVVDPATIHTDMKALTGPQDVKAAFRASIGALDGRARWFHRGLRSVGPFIHELRRVGLDFDADAYSSLVR